MSPRPPAHPSVPAELPLGSAGPRERRRTTQVADGVEWTRITRTGKGGPFRINVLAVDRQALGGSIRVVTGHDRVPGLERTSAMARRRDAVARINGGYFATGAPDTGDPTGVVVATVSF